MSKEIERKFMVKGEPWLDHKGMKIQQGYIAKSHSTVRIRTSEKKAWLTIKGKTKGISRTEFEYKIPIEDANAMLDEFCGIQRIVKTRYIIPYEGYNWEVDVFEGQNAGLVIAEVELESESDTPKLPEWVGEEVTFDARYYNSKLLRNPWPFKF
ncbi:MAG: CYTH domain-containing protein [Lentisphaerales bacterium]|nr:CYTH domain-containing protein [Lentisphaerales bacterium]